MFFAIPTTHQDISFLYAKVNVCISYLDAALFWFLGNCAVLFTPWIYFTIELVRVGFAFILYKGVPQRNAFMCKTFCVGEVILILLGIITTFIQNVSIAHVIWFIIVFLLRVYGIKLIGTFIRMVETELGIASTIPWTIFPEAADASDQTKNAEYQNYTSELYPELPKDSE